MNKPSHAAILCLLALTGCGSTNNVPPSGIEFRLDGCPPLLNCVSSESDVSRYQVDPIKLTEPLTPSSWQRIQEVALALPGASLQESRYGYLSITCYSELFGFPDYLEILASQDQKTLNVRSQSLLGIYDMGVNRKRVSLLRESLSKRGLAAE
ncbi:DUF1499 domain-containing protein [Marinobacter sp. F4216]|uniref:DUF1499 domain-containing protein n=1 Tax=Marinobacter sp. F4216 TaxID=2874281 RepID=UPI001CBC92C2|nr:DUF1499 domain-containing protein [Marinobacter sp. F4216]MBZ2168136.1 DUF1499 domain-containing protein [Marinobacter sp. F4216]